MPNLPKGSVERGRTQAQMGRPGWRQSGKASVRAPEVGAAAGAAKPVGLLSGQVSGVWTGGSGGASMASSP